MSVPPQNAEAGPSRLRSTVESPPPTPLNVVDDEDRDDRAIGVSKNGLSVDENGEVSKLPAFLTKLFKCVPCRSLAGLAVSSQPPRARSQLTSASMVSDPETDKYIYWSENGDSFFGAFDKPEIHGPGR